MDVLFALFFLVLNIVQLINLKIKIRLKYNRIKKLVRHMKLRMPLPHLKLKFISKNFQMMMKFYSNSHIMIIGMI